MQIKKSSSVQLPEGAFTANLTWEGTKLQMQCSALAKKSGHYFFKHDSIKVLSFKKVFKAINLLFQKFREFARRLPKVSRAQGQKG